MDRCGPHMSGVVNGEVPTAVPPSLIRITNLPPRPPNNKLRLTARVSESDVSGGRISHSEGTTQLAVDKASKIYSKNAFDTVYGVQTTQEEICANIVPELLHSLFSGVDCSLVAFGAYSKGKESCLYEPSGSSHGLFQTTLAWTFRLLEEYATKKPDYRYHVRISALHYSQRDNQLVDLLTHFNPDNRRHSLRVVDDPQTGTFVEGESEIRVESVDQALFYLNTVVDHRTIEDEECHRVNHLFFNIHLYGFRGGADGVQSGGKSRLAIIDLGIGERNSQRGELTMPVIGNMLLALYQGQKHLPSRDNVLCLLLKSSLAPSKNSILLCTFTEKADENENMLQLASKLQRTRKPNRKIKSLGDGSSLSSGSPRRIRSEVESSSEQSAPETVIFLGPSTRIQSSPARRPPSQSSVCTLVSTGSSGGRTVSSIPPLMKNHTPFFSPISRLYDDLCSPSTSHPTSFEEFVAFGGVCSEDRGDFGVSIASPAKRSKSRQNLDEEKRKAIMTWMDGHESERADTAIQCGDGDIERETDREKWVPPRLPLEDIIEMDEESMKSSLRSNERRSLQQPRSDPREREGLAEHPLSILSLENLNRVSSNDVGIFEKENTSDEDLDRAMAASVNSIRSHEILSRVANDLNVQDSLNTGSGGTASEMDLYRRASHLEQYAEERIKELNLKKAEENKKKHSLLLNCCQQQSMTSSTGTVVNNWEVAEKKKEKEEEKRRIEELKKRKDELKAEELELRRQRLEIKKELDDCTPQNIARQITSQLQKFSLGSPKHHAPPVSMSVRPSDSLPSTPTVSHRKISLPTRTPSLSNMKEHSEESRETSRHSSRVAPLFQPLAPRTASGSRLPKPARGFDSLPRGLSDSRKSSKTRSRERRTSEHSKEEVVIRSPYAKVTEAKKESGGSSGRGSDDNGSAIGITAQSFSKRNRNRDSYSASSGYESASADYHRFISLKDGRHDRLRYPDKRSNSAMREIDILRDRQRKLKRELTEAKERLGQSGDSEWRSEHEVSAVSPYTLIDTLIQENRILEKRLVACRNHVMVVTSLM